MSLTCSLIGFSPLCCAWCSFCSFCGSTGRTAIGNIKMVRQRSEPNMRSRFSADLRRFLSGRCNELCRLSIPRNDRQPGAREILTTELKWHCRESPCFRWEWGSSGSFGKVSAIVHYPRHDRFTDLAEQPAGSSSCPGITHENHRQTDARECRYALVVLETDRLAGRRVDQLLPSRVFRKFQRGHDDSFSRGDYRPVEIQG